MASTKVFILALVLTIAELAAASTSTCTLDGTELTCERFDDSFFEFDPAYKNVSSLVLKGLYTRVVISPQYSQLTQIELSTTAMRSLRLADFNNLPNLWRIKAPKNILETVDLTKVTGLKRLSELWLHENLIHSINGSFRSLPALQQLSLEDNILLTFDFAKLPTSLASLKLGDNQRMHTLNAGSLKNLTSLKRLSMANSNMAAVDFAVLPANLTSLSLSLNPIKVAHNFAALKQLTALESVNLNTCQLSAFDFAALPPNLRWLDLQNNRISLPNLLPLAERHRRVDVYLKDNPVECTCAFLVGFVFLSHNVGSLCPRGTECFSCAVDSELAAYPWTDSLGKVMAHDQMKLGCLNAFRPSTEPTAKASITTTTTVVAETDEKTKVETVAPPSIVYRLVESKRYKYMTMAFAITTAILSVVVAAMTWKLVEQRRFKPTQGRAIDDFM